MNMWVYMTDSLCVCAYIFITFCCIFDICYDI